MIISVFRLSRADFQKICKENKGVFDTYTIHKMVYSLFPQENEQSRSFLFSYKGGDYSEKRILILSKKLPVKPEIGTIESKEIPASFLEQEYYGFEVQMNPVMRNNKTRKIIPIAGTNKEELLKWFESKAGSYGFEVMSDSLSVSDTDVLKLSKGGKDFVLGKAVFTGRLKVIDRKLFIHSFENGLGKGKAFGFGLFQIIPLTNASVDA